MEIGKTYNVGGCAVTAPEANHASHPLRYSVEKGDARFFYGLDGAWLLHDTYYAVCDRKYNL